MGNRLFVGNLPFSLSEDQLLDLFSTAGTVMEAKIIYDRETGRSRGFGFVEMSSDEDAQKAIEAFNGKDIEGRSLKVNEARPREERGGGGGGGGGGRRDRY